MYACGVLPLFFLPSSAWSFLVPYVVCTYTRFGACKRLGMTWRTRFIFGILVMRLDLALLRLKRNAIVMASRHALSEMHHAVRRVLICSSTRKRKACIHHFREDKAGPEGRLVYSMALLHSSQPRCRNFPNKRRSADSLPALQAT